MLSVLITHKKEIMRAGGKVLEVIGVFMAYIDCGDGFMGIFISRLTKLYTINMSGFCMSIISK